MKVIFVLNYTDDSIGELEMENRVGALPDSLATILDAIERAEKSGKTVALIGIKNRGRLALITREAIMEQTRSLRPRRVR